MSDDLGGGDNGGAPGADALAGGGAAPEWLGALPDDLKGDATLSRYANVEALARGHIETKKLASSRVMLPGAEADETAWNGFFDAIGRPAKADDYEISLPEGDSGEFANAFRPVAHKLGFMPQQVKGLAEWWNGYQAEMVTAANNASKAEIDGLKSELGDQYASKLAAAQSMLKNLGIDAETAEAIDIKLGSANLVKLFMGLAEKAGELGRVDGDPNPLSGSDDADAVLTAKMQDKAWREKYNAGDAETVAEYKRLLDAATKQAVRKRSTALKEPA